MNEETLQYHEFIAESLVCDAVSIRTARLVKRHFAENVHSLETFSVARYQPDSPLYLDLTKKIADVINASLYDGNIEITFHQIPPIEKLKLARKIYVLLDQHGLHCEEKYIFRRLNVLDKQLQKPPSPLTKF